MAAPEKTIFRVHIKGTIDAVWREITKYPEPQGAFFNSVMHTNGLRPGGKLRMRTPSGRCTFVAGDILEFDPPRRFAHTFRFTLHDDPECIVIYELREADGGVEFSMTVENLPHGTRTAKGMLSGSQDIMKNLKAIVETGRPPLGTRIMYKLFAWLEFMLPKKARSENWPL